MKGKGQSANLSSVSGVGDQIAILARLLVSKI